MQITEINGKIDQSRDRRVFLNRSEDTHIEAKLGCGINTATERMYLPEKKGLDRAVHAQLLFG